MAEQQDSFVEDSFVETPQEDSFVEDSFIADDPLKKKQKSEVAVGDTLPDATVPLNASGTSKSQSASTEPFDKFMPNTVGAIKQATGQGEYPIKKEEQNHYSRDFKENNQVVLNRVDQVQQDLEQAQKDAAQLFTAKEASRDMFTSDEAFQKNKEAVGKDFEDTQKKIRTLKGEMGVLGRDYYANKLKIETGKQYPSEIAEAKTFAEAQRNEALDKGGRVGHIYNSLLKGIGDIAAGETDLISQLAVHIPGATAGGTPEENLEILRNEMLPGIREGLKKGIGADVSQKKERKYNDEFLTSAIAGLASSTPAMISPYGSGLFFQAYDSGLQSINNTPKGKELPESTKTIFAVTVGTAQAALEKYGLSKIFGKGSNKVANDLAAKTIGELVEKGERNITKELYETALENKVKSLKSKALKVGAAAAVEAETGAGQEASTILAELGTNAVTGENIYEPKSWGEYVGRVAYASGQEAVGGFAIGGISQISPSSPRNYISEKVSSAKSDEDIANLKQEIVGQFQSGKLSEQAANEAVGLVDKYVAINSKIPSEVTNRKEVADLIAEKEEVQQAAEAKLAEAEKVDEAFKPAIQKEAELLQQRVEEINKEIVTPVQETKEEEKPFYELGAPEAKTVELSPTITPQYVAEIKLNKGEIAEAKHYKLEESNTLPTRVVFKKPISREKADWFGNTDKEELQEGVQTNTEVISVNDIVPTQVVLNKSETTERKDKNDLPVLVRTADGIFVLDGHHRIASEILNGEKNVKAEVIDLTQPQDVAGEKSDAMQQDNKGNNAAPAQIDETLKEINIKGSNLALDKPQRNDFKEGTNGDIDYAAANEKHNKDVDAVIGNLTEAGILTDNQGNEYAVTITSQGVRVVGLAKDGTETNNIPYRNGKRTSGEAPFVNGFKFKPKAGSGGVGDVEATAKAIEDEVFNPKGKLFNLIKKINKGFPITVDSYHLSANERKGFASNTDLKEQYKPIIDEIRKIVNGDTIRLYRSKDVRYGDKSVSSWSLKKDIAEHFSQGRKDRVYDPTESEIVTKDIPIDNILAISNTLYDPEFMGKKWDEEPLSQYEFIIEGADKIKAVEQSLKETPKAETTLEKIVDDYDNSETKTINDLVNEVEGYANETGNEKLNDAIKKYREEQDYDRSVSGRGDMDAANEAIESIIRAELKPKKNNAKAKVEKSENYDFSNLSQEELFKKYADSSDAAQTKALGDEIRKRKNINDNKKTEKTNTPQAESNNNQIAKEETKPISKGVTEKVSTKYVEKPLGEIKTDEKRFQNRTELDEEQLTQIKENWNENELDPVVIWKDKNGESYLLAGHHRLEAAKQLGKKAIDARYFQGTEAEAKKYAIDKSNANRTMEQPYDRAKRLKALREQGASKKEIQEFLKGEGKNKVYVENISHLNPSGKAIAALKQFVKAGDKKTQKVTEQIADWVGAARKNFPELSDAHETEMYDYLLKNSDKVESRDKFVDLVNRRINGLEEFNPSEPLNFEHRVGKGSLENEVLRDIKSLNTEKAALQKEIRNVQKTETNKVARDKKISDLTKQVVDINTKIGDLEKKQKAAAKGDEQQFDIFSQLDEAVTNNQLTDENKEQFLQSADRVETEQPIIDAIEVKGENAESLSDKELQDGIAEADRLIKGEEKHLTEKEKVQKEMEALAERVRKIKLGGLGMHFDLGITKSTFNFAVEMVAKEVEKGTKLGVAIAKAIKWIDGQMEGRKWNKGGFAREMNVRYSVTMPDGKKAEVEVDGSRETAEMINGWYSPLEQGILDSKVEKTTGKEWSKKLKGETEADEMKWTGMEDFLNENSDKSLTKKEVQDFLKNNRVQIVDVVKGAIDYNAKNNNLSYSGNDDFIFLKDSGRNTNYEIRKKKLGYYDIYDGQENIGSRPTLEGAKELAEANYNAENGNPQIDKNAATKFEGYQLEGEKDNYKEVLVTMPNATSKDVVRRRELANIDRERNLTAEEQKEYSELQKRTQGAAQPFKSSHFDEPNILVHLRINTRTDADGKKVLFLEELQSDWGQKGKKEGFALSKQEQDNAYRLKADYEEKQKDVGKYWQSKGSDLSIPYLRENDAKMRQLLDAEEQAYDEYQKSLKSTSVVSIPSAPFVTETPSWTKLALKLALKEAVEQGADKIAWTTGEQQNERYDLSKQVDYVTKHYENRINKEDNTVDVTVSVNNGLMGVVVDKSTGKIVSQNGSQSFGDFKGKGLDEVIGKDIADKILKLDNEEHKLQGDGLKVGGKGMIGFYGSPKDGKLGIVGEVAKSLFGQEPKTVEVKTGSPKIDDLAEALSSPLKKEVGQATSTQHSIDITPELKAQVEFGVPLFKGLTPDEQIARAKGNLKKFFTGKTGKIYDITTLPAEVISHLADLAIGYARKGAQGLKEFIKDIRTNYPKLLKNVTDQELEQQIFDKANSKDGGVPPTEPPKKQEPNLSKGNTDVSALKKRIVENEKAPKEIRDAIEANGISYEIENQELANQYAQVLIDDLGIDGAVELADKGKIRGATKTFIYGKAIDDAAKRLKEGTGTAEEVNALVDKLDGELRKSGREIAAMWHWYINSPEGLAAAEIRKVKKYNDTILNPEVTEKESTPAAKIEKARKKVKKEKKEAAKEAANKVKDKPKPSISISKDKAQKAREKINGAKAKLKGMIFNQSSGFAMTPMNEAKKSREFNDALVELATGYIELGYHNFNAWSAKIKEDLKEIGVDAPLADLQKMWDNEYQAQAKEAYIADNAEKLAKKIIARTEKKGRTVDPVKQMINTLFKKVDEKLGKEPKGKTILDSPLNKMILALKSINQYRDVWEASKAEVLEKIDAMEISEEEKSDLKEQLDFYFKQIIGIPFSDTLANKVVKDALGDNVEAILQQAHNISAETKQEFIADLVDMLKNKTGITDMQAYRIAESFAKEYDIILRKKAAQLLDRNFKQTILDKTSPKRKKDHEKIADAIIWNNYANKKDFENLFAKKFGLIDVTDPDFVGTIKAYVDLAQRTPEGFLRDEVYNNMMQFISWVKGEKRTASNYALAQFYNNILFGVDTFSKAFSYNYQSMLLNMALLSGKNPKMAKMYAKVMFGKKEGLKAGRTEALMGFLGMLTKRHDAVDTLNLPQQAEKFGSNKLLRAWGKYAQLSGKALTGIDLLTSTPQREAKMVELVANNLRKQGVKNYSEVANEIMGWTSIIAESARIQATKEMETLYEKPLDEFDFREKLNYKARVLEIVDKERQKRAYDFGINTEQIKAYKEKSQKWADKSALFGVPEGTLGGVATALAGIGKVLPASKFIMATFINAPLNMANWALTGFAPTGIARAAITEMRGRRGLLVPEGAAKKFGIDIEATRDDKNEMWIKAIGFSAMQMGLAALMGAFDDDDEIKDIRDGKWQEKPFFVTFNMKGNYFDNLEEKRNNKGIEPFTVYYYGHKVFDFKNSPFITIFGAPAAYMDAIRFDKENDTETAGRVLKMTQSYLTYIREQSSMQWLNDIANAMGGNNDYKDKTATEATAKYLAKRGADISKGLVMPRLIPSAYSDFKGITDMDDKTATENYEYFTKDIPILEGAMAGETDAVGRPIKEVFDMESPLGFPIFRYENGQPLLFAEKVIQNDRYYSLFSKKDYQYKKYIQKTISAENEDGEVVEKTLDKKQLKEFNRIREDYARDVIDGNYLGDKEGVYDEKADDYKLFLGDEIGNLTLSESRLSEIQSLIANKENNYDIFAALPDDLFKEVMGNVYENGNKKAKDKILGIKRYEE